MKILKYKDGRIIGEYPDKWVPPLESDIARGLVGGSMFYEFVPDENKAPVGLSRVDAIIADPDELMKLKVALEAAK